MFILRARVVAPLTAPPIKDGAVALDGPLIVDWGPVRRIVSQYGPANEINLTDCLLLPGFINAHTHLELSYLKDRITYHHDFIEWIDTVRRSRCETFPPGLSDEVYKQVMSQACRESLRAGVTTVGDISAEHHAWHYLARLPLRKTCFAEVFGITADLESPAEYLEQCITQTHTDHLLRLGLSPHAPYSVGPDLYRLASRLAQKGSAEQVPLALTTHLAETPQETQFLNEGSGPWLEYLRKIEKWDDSFTCPHQSPVTYFLDLDLPAPPFLLAHVNYLDDAELDRLARSDHSVVYCPRSHHYFDHSPHRFQEMLDAGINLCLGTDSLASNTTLSILDEIRFLHRRYPNFSGETLLKMGTVNGANALGWHDVLGGIAPGMEADLTAVPLTGRHFDPFTNILESDTQPRLTMVRGKIVHHIES